MKARMITFLGLLLTIASSTNAASVFEIPYSYKDGILEETIEKAKDGDRIVVRSGTYKVDTITIEKNITIVGKGDVYIVPKSLSENSKKKPLFIFKNSGAKLKKLTIYQPKVFSSNFEQIAKQVKVGTIELLSGSLRLTDIKMIGEGANSGYGIYTKGSTYLKITDSIVKNFNRNMQAIDSSHISMTNVVNEISYDFGQDTNESLNLTIFDRTLIDIWSSKFIKKKSNGTAMITMNNGARVNLRESEFLGNTDSVDENDVQSSCIYQNDSNRLDARATSFSNCRYGVYLEDNSRMEGKGLKISGIPRLRSGVYATDNSRLNLSDSQVLTSLEEYSESIKVHGNATATLTNNATSGDKVCFRFETTGEVKLKGGVAYNCRYTVHDVNDSIVSPDSDFPRRLKCEKSSSMKYIKNMIDNKCVSCIAGLTYYIWNLNFTLPNGHTPLTYALEKNNYDIIQVLLKHNLDPYFKLSSGKTVLDHIKASRDSEEYLEVLYQISDENKR